VIERWCPSDEKRFQIGTIIAAFFFFLPFLLLLTIYDDGRRFPAVGAGRGGAKMKDAHEMKNKNLWRVFVTKRTLINQ